ncbi:bifunctional RNase H/acid phosphatase [Streptomyces sp. M2CJ-2]|uniref:bifunctional RNase H/acid phosphatase n=1 Tax=Streptomyces sp. M2CJ-2 TaxID=2803948 RepID=UPI0019260A9B|nr:bifunctional RNase H/acid phosphatase [Streptomyces sp. M2CJ-2]MBL3668318.1 bifunctional RNase H/acid phosphatase [Streptomyces sp. M2CJ-2]
MREFIVEADGGSRGNPGPAGYGAVVSDAATGETLREAAEYLGVVTNNVAEYSGLLAGLRAARELDPEATVHVRMDSKLVVEQMSGRWKIKHPGIKPLAAEAVRVFPPGRVTYEWIPREQNKHADRLANEAMDAGARGEAWDASDSRAALDTPGTRPVTPELLEPSGPSERSGPPADAAAGAARARAAEAAAGVADAGGAGADAGNASVGNAPAGKAAADVRAAQAVAAPGTETAAARGPAPAATPSSGWAPADMGPPATFVLLRHGETPLTPQKRFSGSGGSDPSLSDIGREQAEKTAAHLARRGTVQAIVASPLARTRETAGVIAARLGLDVTVDDGLRETDFGAWEGLTFAEVRERHPDDLNAWLSSPDAEPTGGGESFAATANRVAAARDRLTAAHAGRTVLLVTHVTPIKTFVRLALGAPPEALFRMELSAASLSAVAYYADGNASVRLFNETSHLR